MLYPIPTPTISKIHGELDLAIAGESIYLDVFHIMHCFHPRKLAYAEFSVTP